MGQSSTHLRPAIAGLGWTMLFGGRVFLVVISLAPDPSGNANCSGSNCKCERDPITECATVAGITIAASRTALSLGSGLFVGVGHRCGSSGKVFSGSAWRTRVEMLLGSLQNAVFAQELFCVKNLKDQMLVELVNAPDVMIERGTSSRCH